METHTHRPCDPETTRWPLLGTWEPPGLLAESCEDHTGAEVPPQPAKPFPIQITDL